MNFQILGAVTDKGIGEKGTHWAKVVETADGVIGSTLNLSSKEVDFSTLPLGVPLQLTGKIKGDQIGGGRASKQVLYVTELNVSGANGKVVTKPVDVPAATTG